MVVFMLSAAIQGLKTCMGRQAFSVLEDYIQ